MSTGKEACHARTCLGRGDTVVIVGRDTEKAETVPGARFIRADLSLVSENRRVIEQIGRVRVRTGL
ncbi:NAD(P)-dependent dehydrogenase (short-subunit alcohol dehydrogenase family) [Streptosporangium album]|uniref:NAD(P)-dependent dehydrogenase (Short-subunit alcohol dehydrogenase family) n=1 Tax=Streptosporangium album TaxID=47479 RepID=A0A7W7WB66_9ACTN|nr:hypothetical protein [Streptosporangium album]MBB4941157.1 NAD(P)-dependent dehydrogenase (short-subunit alcohol dehydrogenase family) [Streptosporangium album]